MGTEASMSDRGFPQKSKQVQSIFRVDIFDLVTHLGNWTRRFRPPRSIMLHSGRVALAGVPFSGVYGIYRNGVSAVRTARVLLTGLRGAFTASRGDRFERRP
jgi:hypothetical protein